MSGTGEESSGIAPSGVPPPINTGVAHVARVYDYWLGGKENFPADREAAEQAIAAMPYLPASARANRAFLRRAVRWMAAEAGVRQFLDLGTGIPTSPNVHEVAQAVAPEARVVYVDNDPIVLVHARALLTSSPEGATSYIGADLRDPDKILEAAEETLDFTRPVGVLLVAILHSIPDADDPWGITSRLLATVPSGSYLALSHVARDIDAASVAEMTGRLSRVMALVTPRTGAQVARFFDGLELVDPGIVPVNRWHPDPDTDTGRDFPMHCGVARKP